MNPSHQIQDTIIDLILEEIKNGDKELSDSILLNNGYDLDKLNTYAKKLQKQHTLLVNSIINKRKDKALLQKAALLFEDALNNKIQKPIAYLNNLIKQNNFAVQYRNLDQLNKEEIIDIIKDQNLIEILEDLEKQGKKSKMDGSS